MSALASTAQAEPVAAPAPADQPTRTLAQIKDDVLRLDEESLDEFFDWAWHLLGAPGAVEPTAEEVRQIIADAEADRAADVPTKSLDQILKELPQWPTG